MVPSLVPRPHGPTLARAHGKPSQNSKSLQLMAYTPWICHTGMGLYVTDWNGVGQILKKGTVINGSGKNGESNKY